MSRMFLAWVAYHRRSELLASAFDASMCYVYEGRTQGLLRTGLRYLRQAAQSWRHLCAERPQVVIVQNPPIFAVLIAAAYTWRYRAAYLIDSHSGAFHSAKWGWSVWLHRLLSRRALLTLVHNQSQAAIVQRWACRYEVVAYTSGDYSMGQARPLEGNFNVVFVSTFSQDEPFSLVVEAAHRLPDVLFYISGDARKLAPAMRDCLPENCRLTGFLAYEDYVSLLKSADAILALTTRDHTLLMGGFEAVALDKPLITADWPVLVAYFDAGTVHVSLSADGIVQGVQQVRADYPRLQQEMQGLRSHLTAEWDQSRARIAALLAAQEHGGKI